jgi:hypothetical protein
MNLFGPQGKAKSNEDLVDQLFNSGEKLKAAHSRGVDVEVIVNRISQLNQATSPLGLSRFRHQYARVRERE